MIETGVATAVGYAASAYSYNLGRFQFDANQHQQSAHQVQNMRNAQWSLFREDVRDLFNLTSSNMNTYMVIGTLICSCVMNFIWNSYKDFPMDPPWLLLLWNNSVFSCIMFGLHSVWLAMHGSMASNSAAVKILTQAVRPPVPSVTEIQHVSSQQTNYERAGPTAFLQPPAVLKALQPRDPLQPQATVPGGSTMAQDTGLLENTRPVAQLLSDSEGGPGNSAVMYSHFWMLRRVQRGYACFDAYARISLAMSAHQLLLVDGNYAVGHYMSGTNGWPSPTQNTAAAWLALAAAVIASVTLFKLDLFVERFRLRLLQIALIAPPLVAVIACHLVAIRTEFGRGGVRPCEQHIPAFLPWMLALLTCVLHAGWLFLLLWIARPADASGLPMSFRSAIYLDVFGWHSQHFPGLSGSDEAWRSSSEHGAEARRTGSTSSSRPQEDEQQEGCTPFELMTERPDSADSSSKMPWRSFKWTCHATACLWILSFLVIGFNPKYYNSTNAPRELYDRSVIRQVKVAWPHEFFHPSAASCGKQGRTLILGDKTAIYTADMQTSGKLGSNPIQLNEAFGPTEVNTVWKGFALLERVGRKGRATLLLLDRSGRFVVEQSLHGRGLLRNWTVSSMLEASVEAMQVVEGTAASMCVTEASGLTDQGWALYVATDIGQVVVLCPAGKNLLLPLYVLASLRRRKSAPNVINVVDSHTGKVCARREKLIGLYVDAAVGRVWLLAEHSCGTSKLRSWDLNDGSAELHEWPLPSGRRWAPGICSMGEGEGFIIAASAELSPVARPELWSVAASRAAGTKSSMIVRAQQHPI